MVCFLLMIFVLFLLISCAGPQVQKSPAKGVYHIVKKGETAYSIARAYSISLQDLAEINNISDVSLIKEGDGHLYPGCGSGDRRCHGSSQKDDADAKAMARPMEKLRIRHCHPNRPRNRNRLKNIRQG